MDGVDTDDVDTDDTGPVISIFLGAAGAAPSASTIVTLIVPVRPP